MAFTTEFVMGAGGAEVEEIPVSMNGGGGSSVAPTVYPLATVDAGAGAWVWVEGPVTPGSTGSSAPELQVGSHIYRAIGERVGGGGYFTGLVTASVLSRSSFATKFTGKVYVTRV